MIKFKSTARPEPMPPAAEEDKKLRRHRRTLRISGLVAMIIACTFIMSINFQPQEINLTAGQIAGEDIYYSGKSTGYASELATQEARNRAAAEVEQVFVIDDAVTKNLLITINGYRDTLLGYSGSSSVDELRQALPGEYNTATLTAMMQLNRSELRSQFEMFSSLVEKVYNQGWTEDETDTARQTLMLTLSTSAISGESEVFFKNLIEGMELPYNEAYDAVATRAAQDEAMAAVDTVTIIVQSGQKLVSRGSQITAEQIEALQELGLYTSQRSIAPYAGLLLFVTLFMVLFYLYLRRYQRQIYYRFRTLVLISVIILLFVLLSRLLAFINISSGSETAHLIGYLLPIPAASMLLTVLLNRDTAIFTTVLLSVFAVIIMDGQIIYGLTALAGGITGVLTAVRLNQRSQFVNSSIWIILANFAIIVSWGMIQGTAYPVILIGCLFGLVGGLLSAILAMGILPYLESTFGMTTHIRLLELSNSNNPLLKRLMIEAPGTYNHSVLVGNLAEAAADAIGANALLVRVASYYHDIGKLKRPQFYIENQRGGENPHDKLQPSLSAMLITSHTTDGGRMLRETGFPSEIIDIVEQHHGNSLLSFFYNKALEHSADPELVKEADYRYKSRRPQSRECALVMLADSVQAAVQALKNPDREMIEKRVHDVIYAKLLQEDQLRESPLTLRDLDIVEQSFLMVLSGVNHIRISYPDEQLPQAAAIARTTNPHQENHA